MRRCGYFCFPLPLHLKKSRTKAGIFLSFFIFVLIIPYRLVQAVGRQIRTMHFYRRQTFQCICYIIACYFHSFVQSFPFGEIRDHGRSGNGAGATQSLKFDIFDHFPVFLFFDLDVYLHEIPANRITNHADTVRVFNGTLIMRTRKMFDNFF